MAIILSDFIGIQGGSVAINTELKEVVTSSMTVSANGATYLLDTSGGSFTITLPATPTIGDKVVMYDANASYSTNSPIIARNGSKIMGLDEDMTLDINESKTEFIYSGSTEGWVVFT